MIVGVLTAARAGGGYVGLIMSYSSEPEWRGKKNERCFTAELHSHTLISQ